MTSEDPGTRSSQVVRDFLAFNQIAVLSSHSASTPGYPIGSVVPYDIDANGRLTIFISRISEHYRSLEKNPKASLFVADSRGSEDPQPYARASVLGEFLPIGEDEVELVRESYWRRFPASGSRSLAHDFVFRRCTPERIRWIGGFGDIRWISSESYSKSVFDPVSYNGKGIAAHMNEDHRDALSELVGYHHGIRTTALQCQLVSINARGFFVEVESSEGSKRLEIPFRSAVKETQEVRNEMIELLKLCRQQQEEEDLQ